LYSPELDSGASFAFLPHCPPPPPPPPPPSKSIALSSSPTSLMTTSIGDVASSTGMSLYRCNVSVETPLQLPLKKSKKSKQKRK
jgi:hypothetical protein